MFGLSGAGKTQLLYRFILNACIHTIPTIGFNSEEKEIGNQKLIIHDCGGCRRNMEKSWIYWIQDADAIIFVIDSADKERLRCLCNDCNDCIYEKMKYLIESKESKNLPILIFANKQDLILPYSAKELETIFDCEKLFNGHKWKIRQCSAINENCNDIDEGFKWLVDVMKK